MTSKQIQYYHTLKLRTQIALLTRKSLNPYANQAITGLVADGYEQGRSMCQKWAREQRQAVSGSAYNRYDRGNARDTARALQNSPYVVPKGQPLQDGDFLYDFGTVENMGHVVIVLPNHWYANNSIRHWDGVDGRGMRKDYTYTYWDLAVRFPIPK